ncbi:cyclin-T isoform X2 [Condylostylus longicornis]|uniref:cyclin-T isoform X2 n=1 Tax=Condylostylus longicornis TaxID=2530218 RepID=UPI00244E3537|nr:cyclin-T isoform X2 [Condylostylus longicornis]
MASTSTNNNSSAGPSNPTSGSNTNNNSLGGGDSRWYFTAEQLTNSPSRRQGIDADEELSYRQMTAYLIQEMGQRLQVSQLCINTAIVYMHRFYAFHSFTHFHRNGIAAASLFLAAKVEEQPRKLEHVIKAAHLCLNQEPPASNSEVYAEQAQDLVFNENVLLQTLGFDVAIDHPHTHVVKTCHLVKACKDLAQTSYFLASNSLHLTSMCLQYRPTVVACFCIYLACKWSRWEIPQSTEGKHWFHYVDKSVTMELLQQLTNEFIAIYEKSPARLKSKLNSVKAIAQGARIPEPPRNASDSSNGSSSSQQLNQVPPTVIQQQSQPSSSSSSSSSSVSSRRPETASASHSSHHRSHHAGVQHPHHHHHHHHHSKHANAADVIDHKQPNKPYPNNTANHSNRPRAERAHQQGHIVPTCINNDPNSQYQTNKQMTQSKSSGSNSSSSARSGMSQISTIPPILQPQQSMTLGSSGRQNLSSQMHDMNYHKSRVNPNSVNLPNQMNSQMTSNHKIVSSKNPIDPNRNMLKDPSSGRDSKIPVKHNSLSSNSSNVYSQQQPSVGLDMTRNVLQQQQQNQAKGYVQSQMASGLPPPSNYQQQSNNRANNNSNTNSNVNSNLNSGNKFDQSVQQQSLLSQHQQKQSIESSSFSHSSNISSSTASFTQNNSQISNDHMDICSPPRYSTSQNQVQQPPIPTQSHKPFLSIFSPDYNEKQQQLSQQLSQQVNNVNSSSNKQIFSNKINRDSPKKEKRSNTPKKEKRLEAHHMQSEQKTIDKRLIKNDMLSSNSSTIAPINLNYGPPNNQSQTSQLSDFNYNAPKRPNSVKIEEDTGRETKIRKVDHPTVEVRPASFLFDQTSNQTGNNLLSNSSNSINIQEATKTKLYPSTINGIETNPDLVSSLLKESLCNENKYASQPSLIKTERPESPIATTPSVITTNTFIKTEPTLSPIQSGYNINPMESLPQELLQNTSTFNAPFVSIKQEPNQFPVSTPVVNNVALVNQPFTTIPQPPHLHQQQVTLQPQIQQQQPPPQQQQQISLPQSQQHVQPQSQSQPHPSDEYSKCKSEKKKKKDKHKHKEKDKSKDKEERKKHKKDKDKHKDKEKDREKTLNINEPSEPVKLKIPKDKLNLPPIEAINVSPGQLKIKIPKDRIKTEINSNNDLDGQIGATNQSMPQMPLKIKISKDKIGSFGHDSISVTTSQHSSLTGHSSSNCGGNLGSNNLSISSNITGSSSSSSKKKDRDKDKDKERKRNSDLNKHSSNGGSGNGGSGMSTSTAPSKSTSSKLKIIRKKFLNYISRTKKV